MPDLLVNLSAPWATRPARSGVAFLVLVTLVLSLAPRHAAVALASAPPSDPHGAAPAHRAQCEHAAPRHRPLARHARASHPEPRPQPGSPGALPCRAGPLRKPAPQAAAQLSPHTLDLPPPARA